MIKVTTASFPGIGGRPYHSLPKQCSYLISVGKEHFQGKYLKSTLALIASEFEECTLIITGTLQRFNIEALEGETAEKSYSLSLKREQDFIKKFNELINVLKTSCKFIFISWDEYRENKSFNDNLGLVRGLLLNDKTFSDAMKKTVEVYCEKHLEKGTHFSKNLFIEKSNKFLEEECAAMFFWPKQLTLYPSGATPILSTMSKYINSKTIGANELSWHKIRFKTKRIKKETVITSRKRKDHLDTAILQVEKINIIYAPTIFKKRKSEINDKFKLCNKQLDGLMKLTLRTAKDKSEVNDYLLIVLNKINEFKKNIDSRPDSSFKEKRMGF